MSEVEPKYIVGITRQLEYAGDTLSLDAMRHIFHMNKEAVSLEKRIADLEAENERLRGILHAESDWVFLQSPDDEPINQNRQKEQGS